MQFPASLCVSSSVSSRLTAVRRLVQPGVFTNLAVTLTAQTGTAGIADPVVVWMREMFASSRLRYKKDPVLCNGLRNADLWRSPQATFANGGGDCEDLSIVVVSAMIAYGLRDAWLVVGAVDHRGHAWVEGSDATSPFLVEATSPTLVRNVRPEAYVPSHRFHPVMGAQAFTDDGWQSWAAWP